MDGWDNVLTRGRCGFSPFFSCFITILHIYLRFTCLYNNAIFILRRFLQ